jgi:hypothetical protein
MAPGISKDIKGSPDFFDFFEKNGDRRQSTPATVLKPNAFPLPFFTSFASATLDFLKAGELEDQAAQSLFFYQLANQREWLRVGYCNKIQYASFRLPRCLGCLS